MKHLRKYNESNDNLKDIVQELEDIALELKDIGFTVVINSNLNREYIKINHIQIYTEITTDIWEESKYDFSEIRETYERMVRYMETVGWKLEEFWYWDSEEDNIVSYKNIPNEEFEDINSFEIGMEFKTKR